MTADNIEAQWEQTMRALMAKGTVPSGTVTNWLCGLELIDFSNDTIRMFAANWVTQEKAVEVAPQVEAELSLLVGHPVKFTVQCWKDDDEDAAAEGEGEGSDDTEANSEISIAVAETQRRAAITRPDRVVMVDRYLLRWVGLVGADCLMATIGLKQLAYLSNSTSVTTTTVGLTRWCGLSRNTLLALFKRDEFNLLVHRTAREPKMVSGRQLNQSAVFTLPRVWPLLPADARIIENLLRNLDLSNDPLGVLSSLLAGDMIDLSTILPFEPDDPDPDDVKADWTYVSTLCRRLTKGAHLTPEQTIQMDLLAEQLQERIVHRGTVCVPWYFLLQWSPILGPEASVLVMQLRARTFFNSITGEVRSSVKLPLQVLSGLCGASVDTLGRWFPVSSASTDQRHQVKRDALSRFVRRDGTEFMVLEPGLAPLLPEHEQAVVSGILDSRDPSCSGILDSREDEASGILDSRGPSGSGKLDSRERENWTLADGNFGLSLKTLNQNTLNTSQELLPPPSPSKLVVEGSWDFEGIIRRKVVSQAAQTKLLEDPQRFLAWLIAGFVDPKITNPVSLAVTTCTRTQTIPDKRFADLVDRGPSSLQEALETIAEAKTEGTIAEILDPESEWIPLLQKLGPRAADLLLILGIPS